MVLRKLVKGPEAEKPVSFDRRFCLAGLKEQIRFEVTLVLTHAAAASARGED